MDAEQGDLMVSNDGKLFRLEKSSGWGAKSAGVLYPRTIKPPRDGMVAMIRDGEVWWSMTT